MLCNMRDILQLYAGTTSQCVVAENNSTVHSLQTVNFPSSNWSAKVMTFTLKLTLQIYSISWHW